MYTIPVSTEVARQAPLTASAVYVSFISMYGSEIVITLAVVYGVLQIIFRIAEHRKIMRGDRHERKRR